MAYLNMTAIAGNLTRDPELEFVTGDEIPICRFGVAVNHPRREDKVSFFEVVAWRGLAEIVAEYKNKGDAVIVKGELEQQRWETDEGNRSRVVIVADEVNFLSNAPRDDDEEEQPRRRRSSNRSKNGSSRGNDRGNRRKQKEVEEEFDDIPF